VPWKLSRKLGALVASDVIDKFVEHVASLDEIPTRRVKGRYVDNNGFLT
jgi:hypothetical protein